LAISKTLNSWVVFLDIKLLLNPVPQYTGESMNPEGMVALLNYRVLFSPHSPRSVGLTTLVVDRRMASPVRSIRLMFLPSD
jgi:hypothetical protein